MGRLLDQFEVCYPGCNRAAIASQWHMNFLSVFMPAVVVPPLAVGQALDLEDHDLTLLHDQAKPMALVPSRRPLDSRPEQWPEYWQRLFSAYLTPGIRALAQSGGLAPKVLWNNVVVVWDEVFRRIGLHLSDQSVVESAHQWLDEASVRGGRLRLRPLQRWVDSPAPELVDCLPLRRHCCLHYQLHDSVPDEFPVWCESCPKLHREPATEQARYLYQLQEDEEEEDA